MLSLALAAQTTAGLSTTIIEGNMATLAGLTETGNALLINVTDASVAASALNTLNVRTTVAVNATAVATVTGTVAECDNALDANATGTITGIGDVECNLYGQQRPSS